MAVSATSKTHRCIQCKLPGKNSDCICCSKCSAWYHGTCTHLTNAVLHTFKNTSKKFKCNLCSTKTNCHSCNKKYYPRSQRVHCLNCSHSYCSKCISSGKNIKFFLSPENEFYCNDCDKDFYVSNVKNHARTLTIPSLVFFVILVIDGCISNAVS